MTLKLAVATSAFLLLISCTNTVQDTGNRQTTTQPQAVVQSAPNPGAIIATELSLNQIMADQD